MLSKPLKITGITLLILTAGLAVVLIYVKTMLPDVGDAPDITIRATPSMIERGHYLANHVTVCIDCHSHRDWTRYGGPVVPGTEGEGGELFGHSAGFPGTIYSKNITPAALGGWTDGEIYRTITTGVTKEGRALFPVMPYHFYGVMDPQDVNAIIAYIRTLTPRINSVPEREIDFPMNFIVNTIPQKARPMQRPPQTDTLAYGHYLVQIAGCQECHTRKVKGKIAGPAFAGGWEFQLPDGSIVRSANITPDPATGIGHLSSRAFVHLFKSYADSSYSAPQREPGQVQTVMPWIMFSGMDTTDLNAIYAYLRSVQPEQNKVVHFTPPRQTE